MKDEIAREIADELRLIRVELQKLTSVVKSSTNRSGNFYSGKSGKSYQGRGAFPTESGLPGGPQQQRSPRSGEPRRQWHLPKDSR
jgi:hypothetical protein